MKDTPDELLDRWGLTILSMVADTGHARIWKVETADTVAALKVYRRADRGNEGPGSRLLSAWQDRGAVRILEEANNAVLMEWLDGPPLGDVARDGDPETAVNLLAEAASHLHRSPRVEISGLRTLNDVFAPLFRCEFTDTCDPNLKSDMQQSAALARELLGIQQTLVPLHGDLHTDNVILTKAGPKVIDAKGYLGDPAFELANALRHPKGMPDLVRDPIQIAKCLQLYSEAMAVTPERLAKWAAAKCALSIYWRSHQQVSEDKEADLLRLFLQAAA